MGLHQPIQLEQAPPPKAPLTSPTGVIFQGWQKASLLILLLGILYLRQFRKRQARRKICSHCAEKNPIHLTNCAKCGAPLF